MEWMENMERRWTPARFFLSIALLFVLLLIYIIFAGSVHSISEIAPTVLNVRFRQVGRDVQDFHKLKGFFPTNLSEIQSAFERYATDYWDVYSHDGEQPFGYEIVGEASSEVCLLYTARVETPIGIVESASGEVAFRTTEAYSRLRESYLARESRGLSVWREAPLGEKLFFYFLLPHRAFENRFMVSRDNRR